LLWRSAIVWDFVVEAFSWTVQPAPVQAVGPAERDWENAASGKKLRKPVTSNRAQRILLFMNLSSADVSRATTMQRAQFTSWLLSTLGSQFRLERRTASGPTGIELRSRSISIGPGAFKYWSELTRRQGLGSAQL
jgi:hypothetical protein